MGYGGVAGANVGPGQYPVAGANAGPGQYPVAGANAGPGKYPVAGANVGPGYCAPYPVAGVSSCGVGSVVGVILVLFILLVIVSRSFLW